jgi:hypothetical protein
MKRLFLLSAALILMACAAYAFSKNQNETTLYIGVFPEASSYLIDIDGSIDLFLFFSRPNSMYVERELIQQAVLVGEDAEASMIVRAIEATTAVVSKNGRTFQAYRFELALGFIAQEGFAMEWRNATLTLQYNDANRLELPIGSLSIRVGTVDARSPLSLLRLYGRKGDACGIDRIMVGIRNLTDDELRITQWRGGDSLLTFVMDRIASDHPDLAVARLDLFGTEVTAENDWIPPGASRYIVLRLVDEEHRLWRRFHLEAEWRAMGTTDVFLIDDFVFVSEEGGRCGGSFVEIAIRYPRGRN